MLAKVKNLVVIDGPKHNVLNARGDGPCAFSDRISLAAFAATQWLLDYAEDADATPGCWHSPQDIFDAYPVQVRDPETGREWEIELSVEDITERGLAILEAACQGKATNVMLFQWSLDIASPV